MTPMPPLLPSLTVSCNLTALVCLLVGWQAIRRRDIPRHRRAMLAALGASALFLAIYLYHHATGGGAKYPWHDWTRPLYFAILIPHVILAAVVTPFVLCGAWLALRGRFTAHARLMRYVLPVWLYVSVTGVLVYVCLYLQPLVRE